MISINSKGELVYPLYSGKELKVNGILFMDEVYRVKCKQYACTGQYPNNEERQRLYDQVTRFSI
jgi:hypothetical protein